MVTIFQEFDQALMDWNEFVNHHRLSPTLNPLIAASWERCWPRLNPHGRVNIKHLNPNYLLAAQVASFDLLSVARPIMEDIYQYIEKSETAAALVNGTGFVLDIIGDPAMIEATNQLGITTGACITEIEIGTNAFSLAITERVPVQVCGAEHYLQQFHGLAEAAAPIFDLSGRPLGAFGLINFYDQQTPHTLGLAVAGARAIEGQRQSDLLLAEQISHLAELNAILEANSDGILMWNSEGILMHVNAAAAKIISRPLHTLVGRNVADIFVFPAFFLQAHKNQEPLTDVEASIRVFGQPITCILSLRFVRNYKGLQWTIVTLRQEKAVRQLVHHQVGAHALLTLEDMPGISPGMKRVHRMVKTAAAAQASILIRGESGTGKNVLANAIHNESPRRDGPFLIFACSSTPNELVVRELLGMEEGLNGKRGGGRPSKFELAQGGTLFFQDVDVLPLEAQAILLNVIELGIVQRIGSDRPIAVDVRIIAATSANMEKLIAQGNFRADLFYRLSAFEITLPPLRERQKDIPLLVDRILKRLSNQLNRSLCLTPEALDLLKKYSWPGNVRELEAVLGQAAVRAGVSEIIDAVHLPNNILHPNHYARINPAIDTIPSLSEIERITLLQTAQSCFGNVSEMARILGISRTTVWRKLREFNISAKDFRSKPLDTSPNKVFHNET
ncbi:MAG: sigma 54-interacting transcriptional regulator [Anaerolineales bacterium]|nr:sigma 54-interacting transcriptional regulator [Anaerolineales bacterium]